MGRRDGRCTGQSQGHTGDATDEVHKCNGVGCCGDQWTCRRKALRATLPTYTLTYTQRYTVFIKAVRPARKKGGGGACKETYVHGLYGQTVFAPL